MAGLKLCFISDTHGVYPAEMPAADVLVHSGDFSRSGSRQDLVDFQTWLLKVRHLYKKIIVCPGNHDKYVQGYTELSKQLLKDSCTLLVNKTYTYEGVVFYASPYTPKFGHRWAYQLMDKAQAQETWAKIPDTVDVLVTHGPPRGILDMTARGVRDGCPWLLDKVLLVRPKIHAFGHIHEGHGTYQNGSGTLFVNSAYLDENYLPQHAPIVVSL
jgi:Icc-related predicted phosphoesterase